MQVHIYALQHVFRKLRSCETKMIEFIEHVSKNLEELVGFCCQVWSICSSNFREQTLSVDNTLDCPSELKKKKTKTNTNL